jgi:SAM-dependent methyltransferase
MRYVFESFTNPEFKEHYENYMLARCGKDKLPEISRLQHGIFHNYRPWEYDKVYRYGNFKEDDILLDTGAMHTYFCIFLCQYVKQIYVTDNFYWAQRDYMRKERLWPPSQWMEYIKAKGQGKIKAEKADLENLPYHAATFDKVICISTIEHVRNDFKAMQEIARVLKKGGRLLLTTEFNFFFGKVYCEHDNSYYRVYTAKTLKELVVSSGLRLLGAAIVENKRVRYIRPHKKVNIFLCLEK